MKPPQPGRAVYLGRISRSRGLETLLAVADLVAPDITVELIGYADPEVEADVVRADRSGRIRWRGFIRNAAALDLVEGATAGLSLLRDEPNFRGSLPTKVAEYMARGVPVVTTPLPEAVHLLDDGRCGTVVPFEDPESVADAILRYHRSHESRLAASRAGREQARAALDWNTEKNLYLEALTRWAAAGR